MALTPKTTNRKAIEKKLRQIAELEEKQSRGNALNDDQLAKLRTKGDLENELRTRPQVAGGDPGRSCDLAGGDSGLRMSACASDLAAGNSGIRMPACASDLEGRDSGRYCLI